MKTPTVAIAAESDAERGVATMVLAFGNDPAVRWMYPDAHQYLENFPAFVRAFGGGAFREQTAFGVDYYRGVALWHAPGAGPNEEALVALLERSVAETHRQAVFSVLEQMGGYHPQEPHWHLPLVGVDPSHQGKGYGSALMKHALAACDRDRMPAYLESTNPKNVSLYERHGFKVIGRIQVPGSPPIMPMLRAPRV